MRENGSTEGKRGRPRGVTSDTQRQRARLLDRMSDGVPRTYQSLKNTGVSQWLIRRMVYDGELQRSSKGIYRLGTASLDRHSDFADIALLQPGSVICYATAANEHDLTTSEGHYHIGIPRDSRLSLILARDLGDLAQPHKFSPSQFAAGVETLLCDGVEVSITSPARTVLDAYRAELDSRIKSGCDFDEVFSRYVELNSTSFEERDDAMRQVSSLARKLGYWDRTLQVLIQRVNEEPLPESDDGLGLRL